jgi:hypothetical protein
MVRRSVNLMSTWIALEMIAAQQVKAGERVRAKCVIPTID